MKSTFNRFILLLLLLCCTLTFAQESTTVAQTKEDTITQINSLRNKVREAMIKQDVSTVLFDLNKANELASAIGDNELQAATYNDLADFYSRVQNHDLALAEVNKAILLLKDNTGSAVLADSFVIEASLYAEKKDFDNASRNLDKAYAIYEGLENRSDMAIIQLNKGLLALEQNNATSAVNYLDASLSTFEELGLKYYQAQAMLNKSKALLLLAQNGDQQRLDQSVTTLDEAVKISKENNFAVLITQSKLVKSDIAKSNNNYQEAYTYLEQFYATKDSLSSLSMEVMEQEAKLRLERGDYDEIIENLRANIAEKDSSIKMNNFTSTLSIALIIILSLLTLSLYKNNNLRAKANDLLQDKNSELQLAKEKAEKASLAKAQFLSTITHELRTPLYAVTGLTHLLLEENPLEHQKEHLNSLKFSGDYLLSLINNILDLNKLEANKVEIEKTTFNLEKRINDVLVALKKSADDRNNKLLLEFDHSIPPKLLGDPLKISQILINLVGNSVKFTENGQVVIRVQKIEETADNVMLHFEIEDNGVGISKKKQKSIFETFSQGSLQINRKFGGTGLGLSIVKNLLQLMNSKIYLESQLGKGSKFSFDIKFAISDQFKEDKNPHNIIYDIDYVALENLTVLVVEDNKINQMITKKILEKNKMKCDVADNGETAVEMVQKHPYHIVLMDIHMPGISGIEATQQIRKFNKEIPIIALTAVTIDENLDEFYRAGFNEIIPKPFKTEEFFEKIHRTLFMNKTPV
ncbi:MAG: response regulator [Gilvibacter sp.]